MGDLSEDGSSKSLRRKSLGWVGEDGTELSLIGNSESWAETIRIFISRAMAIDWKLRKLDLVTES